jgi:hypothetical protein
MSFSGKWLPTHSFYKVMTLNLLPVGSNIAHVLKPLSIAEIIAASPSTSFGRADKRSRSHLLTTVAMLSHGEQSLIRKEASTQHGLDSPLVHALKPLRISEIIAASPTTRFSRADARSRAHLLSTVAGLSQEEQNLICCVASAKAEAVKTDGEPPCKRFKVDHDDPYVDGAPG